MNKVRRAHFKSDRTFHPLHPPSNMNAYIQTKYLSNSSPQDSLPSQSDTACDLSKDFISTIDEFYCKFKNDYDTFYSNQSPFGSGDTSVTSSKSFYKPSADEPNNLLLETSNYHSDDNNATREVEHSRNTIRRTKGICKQLSSTLPHPGAHQKTPRVLWKPEEDAVVLYHIASLGRKWSHIAKFLCNRTGKQVRDRYLNHLQPDIRSDEWTSEEDELLIKLYHKHGKKWCSIASELQGRTEAQVKNRFYTHIRQLLRRRSKEGKEGRGRGRGREENENETIATSLIDSPYENHQENSISQGERIICDLVRDTDPNMYNQQQTYTLQQKSESYSTYPDSYYPPQTDVCLCRRGQSSSNMIDDPDGFISCDSGLINAQKYNKEDNFLSDFEKILIQELRNE